MDTFKGKVFAITGAGSGIGAACTKVLFSRGASLALCDLHSEGLDKVAQELKPTSPEQRISVHTVDVRSTEQVNQWIDGVVKDFSKLDGAANVAGIVRKLPFGTLIEDTTDEDWELTMQTNAFGVFRCLRAQLKAMTNGGAIVNIASVAGLDGAPGCGAYSPSKHAVIGLTRTAAREAAARGIRVNAIAPGLIDTPMAATEGFSSKEFINLVPVKRMAQPEEIGRMIAVLLSDDSSYMTGETIRVDGGLRA